MRRAARFLLALLAGLALLAALGNLVLAQTWRAWFENDLTMRSQLAVGSAKKSLTESWSDPHHLTEVLSDITRDKRILGAAACSSAHELVAWTQAFPREFSCEGVLGRMKEENPRGEPDWSMTQEIASGRVHLSVPPLDDALGTVILVHEMGYLDRREQKQRNILLIGFFVLS